MQIKVNDQIYTAIFSVLRDAIPRANEVTEDGGFYTVQYDFTSINSIEFHGEIIRQPHKPQPLSKLIRIVISHPSKRDCILNENNFSLSQWDTLNTMAHSQFVSGKSLTDPEVWLDEAAKESLEYYKNT